jgi:ApbE superfamily uncharacterized protein (UPF0280 family)
MAPLIFCEPRTYREFDEAGRFKTFRVVVEQSDLYVKALASLERQTEELIRRCRADIEAAIARRPEFLTSLEPLEGDPADAPVALKMIRAGKKAGVGPMAAVAGAVAEYVGRSLLPLSPELIIENGGDIFLMVAQPVIVGMYAGKSPLNGKFGIRVEATPMPVGVCTSSAKIGPSLSLGKVDCATIVARDVGLADAVATGLGNRIQRPGDLTPALEWALSIPGVDGALAVLDDKLAALGDIELVPAEQSG